MELKTGAQPGPVSREERFALTLNGGYGAMPSAVILGDITDLSFALPSVLTAAQLINGLLQDSSRGLCANAFSEIVRLQQTNRERSASRLVAKSGCEIGA